MLAAAQQYPAKTAGHGGEQVTGTRTADGWVEFNVEAKIVDW